MNGAVRNGAMSVRSEGSSLHRSGNPFVIQRDSVAQGFARDHRRKELAPGEGESRCVF